MRARKRKSEEPIEEGFTIKDLLRTRLRMKLNQTEFGAKLGYRHPQIRISELETGRKRIPARVEMICMEINRKLTEKWG